MFTEIICIGNVFVGGKEQPTVFDLWGEEKTKRFWQKNFWNGITLEQAREYLLSIGEVDIANEEKHLYQSTEKQADYKTSYCGAWKWIDNSKRIPRVEFEGEMVYFCVNGTTRQSKVKKFLNKKAVKRNVQ